MKYGLVGNNVTNSLSKAIHEELSSIDYELLSLSDENEFKELFKTDFNGINVTIPFKGLAYELCDIVNEEAEATKTVNTIIKKAGISYGFNTDIYGFESLLDKYQINVKDQNCLIMGTGATSRTVAYVLNLRGANILGFLSRNPSQPNHYSYDSEIVNKASIIINATPYGKDEKEAAIPLLNFQNLENLQCYIDVIYSPLKTINGIEAKKRCSVYGGLYMLVAQAAKAEEYFSDKKYSDNDIQVTYKKIFIENFNIAIIGHPLSGKSTIAEALSKILNLECIDTDNLIEKSTNKTIPSIFKEGGEPLFRKYENDVLSSLKNTKSKIISTGGGTILNQDNLTLLSRNSLIVNINRNLDLIDDDINGRPLTKNKDDLRRLIDSRKNLYIKAADIEISNNGNINDAVEEIWRQL